MADDQEHKYESLTTADRIWNRACGEVALHAPIGDIRLSALLLAHGYAMNGGVLHMAQGLTDEEWAEAVEGYKHFGLAGALDGIGTLRGMSLDDPDFEAVAARAESAYDAVIPDDATIERSFLRDLRTHAEHYAPLP